MITDDQCSVKSKIPVALVTGGARDKGIGKAIAQKLLVDNFHVVVMDTREPESAVDGLWVSENSGSGESAFFRADISRTEDRSAVFKFVKDRFGRLDVLVNNAGVGPREASDLLDMSEDSMDFVLGVNLRGTFFMTQAAANWMIAQMPVIPGFRPAIVNISSISAYTSSVERGQYCISKAGISMITLLFADRLAEFGIPVHEIRPGIIRTDLSAPAEVRFSQLIHDGLIPIKRWGLPQDVADAVAILVSGQLAYSTGQVINVDGGFHIRRL